MLMYFLKSNMWMSAFTRCSAAHPRLDVSRWLSNLGSSSSFVGKSVNLKQVGQCSFPFAIAQVDGIRLFHKLRVKNLPKEATEDVLREYFSKFGMVLSVKLVRKKRTLESRGDGYVVFADKQALEHTLNSPSHVIADQIISVNPYEAVNFIVQGLSPSTTRKSLKVYFSHYGKVRECEVKHNSKLEIHRGIVYFMGGSNIDAGSISGVHDIDGKQVEVRCMSPEELTLYVGNLSPLTTDQSLAAYFSQFGTLSQSTVNRDRLTGQSRKFGFVSFSSHQELDSAIRSVPHVVDGSEVKLEYSTGKFTLFFAGLPPGSTEQSLKQYFEQFGPVYSCTIARDKQTSRLRDFGWVTFSFGEWLNNALAARPLVIDGKFIDAKPSQKQISKAYTLFVGGLSPSTTDAMLFAAFSKFGFAVSCYVKCDKVTGRSRGFGYVVYSTLDEVSKAMLAGPHVVDGQVVDVKLPNRSASM